MRDNKRVVAFIDLLGTKESHKVSDSQFEEHMDGFLWSLISSASILSKEFAEVNHFSDCAFISVNDKVDKLFEYLNSVREKLLAKDLYFKCGINFSGGKKYDNSDEKKIFSTIDAVILSNVQEFCQFKIFGPDVVPSYLNHEKLKGAGFYVDKEVAEKYKQYCVNSVFVSDRYLNSYVTFYDIRFSGRLVDTVLDPLIGLTNTYNPNGSYDKWYQSLYSNKKRIPAIMSHAKLVLADNTVQIDELTLQFDRIIQSIKRAYIKDKNYPKYYISLLITIIRSSAFEYIWYDSESKLWRGYPHAFKRLVVDKLYSRTIRKFNGYELLIMSILSQILLSTDIRRSLVLKNTNEEKLREYRDKKLIPKDFRKNSEICVLPDDHPCNYYIDIKNTEDILKIYKDTESKAILDYINQRGGNVAGELRSIPDAIINEGHKNRIEIEYSMLEN